MRLFQCESGMDARAHNPNDLHESFGIAQVNGIWGYAPEELYDPVFNIKVAKEIFDKQGFSAWENCYRIIGGE